MEKLTAQDPQVTRFLVAIAIWKDLVVRAPIFAVLVAALMGGIAYTFTWIIVHILKPAILGG